MAYSFDQIFAADPSNPANVAKDAAVTIFAPGDETMTPLTITDPDGQPLANPIVVNANGFGSAFAHATLDRVAWAGGGFTGFFTSYEGMKNEATAAREAAETAAAEAGAQAVVRLDELIAAGSFEGPAGPLTNLTVGTVEATPGNPLTDEIIAAEVTTGTATKAALDGTYGRKDGRVICKGFTRADVIAALDEAEAKGRHTVVYFPRGVYDVGNGLSLSGYSAQIQGAGAGGQPTLPTGTVFYASTQTGPVLDFTGWIIPTNVFTGRVKHSDFMVRGSGVADPTKNNAGIRLKIMSSATFADIAIRDTGGPCLESTSNPGNAVYLCDFERIILNTPVGAKDNDVPWFIMDEPNGNRFRGIGLRSMSTSADVGVSGAVVIKSNATYPSYASLYDAWWFENLHIPSGGTIVSAQCHTSDFINFSWHDILKESGATGTSYMRFTPPAVGDFGGNNISGLIPGSEGGVTPDMGIDMRQSRNRVVGVKGYKGKNVTIASGVTDTRIELAGAMSTATDPAVVDNSGSLTNSWADRYMNLEVNANRSSRDTYVADTGVTRFYDTTTTNNGGVALGKAGARVQSIGGGGALWLTPASGQATVFTDGALAEIFRVLANGVGIKMAAGKTLQLGTSTTAGRQSAVTAGAGAVAYDTTLSKPIYSDGTVWRDAAGTAV